MKTYKFLYFLLFIACFSCEKPETATDNINYTGGLEPHSPTTSVSPRVLINGGLLGFQDTLCLSTFWAEDNVMVDAKYCMERLHYTVSFDSNTSTWVATRNAALNQIGVPTLTLKIGDKKAVISNNIQAYNMPIAPILQRGKVFVPARFLMQMAGCSTLEWDIDSYSFQTYFQEDLDYGIYFYGKQTGSNDAVGAQKFVAGQPNLFFDPTKPTLIYTHGWQLDGVKNNGRESFLLKNDSVSLQTQNFWIDRGWNVAIFHWIQLADDGGVPPPREAEAKIYDVNNSLAGMRWKRTGGKLVTESALLPHENVSQLYANTYQAVFGQNYTGSEIRLVGNSLGGNLTLAMLMELHHRNCTYMPQRVALIDPYWSPNLTNAQASFPYGYSSAGDLATASATIQRDNYGTAIEYLRSSLAGQTGTVDGVVGVTAFSHFGTDYSWNVLNKHTVPVRQYLWSIAFAAPAELSRPNATANFTATGNVAGSAATSNLRIRELMRNDKYWNHIGGRSTITPNDDTFEIRNGLY